MDLPYNPAVRAQRSEPVSGPDDFPTPPWGTRALFEHVIPHAVTQSKRAWEPCSGRGHMADVLDDYFFYVCRSDIHEYGDPLCDVVDFSGDITYPPSAVDWIITNPPFNKGVEFAIRALRLAPNVAFFCRLQWLEGIQRRELLFKNCPPAIVAPFCERITLLKGRLKSKTETGQSTATAYAWFVWLDGWRGEPVVRWIPPCRKALERDGDYD